MSLIFTPTGTLNVAADASELPEGVVGNNIVSGAMTRCKNLRLSEQGKAKTRDGSTKLNGSAINTAVWWIEEQGGQRYTFAGTIIYKDETSIETGLTSAQWSAIKYNSYNDTSANIFALNGTDRKRINGSDVEEWGLEAPSIPPVLTPGQGTGLTGIYNVKYTYVRKVDDVVVCESNPSPAATSSITLTDQSIGVTVTDPTDTQVTHIRIYRTLANGDVYYLDSEIDVSGYDYGYTYDWEETDDYISGTGYQFTTASTESAVSGGGGAVSISSTSSAVYKPFPTTATAGYKLGSDGLAYKRTGFGGGSYMTISGQWLLSGSASDYECYAEVASGSSPTTGTLNTWLALSTTRTWELSSSSGTANSVLNVYIRDVATSTIQDSAQITLEADSS